MAAIVAIEANYFYFKATAGGYLEEKMQRQE
jgi:hypothetical protein